MQRDNTEQRVGKDDGVEETRFLWDATRLIEEHDDDGVQTARYHLEPADYGNLVSQHRDAETNWHHFDALGSTTELTDDAEVVTDDYRYEAFGKEASTTGATPNPHRWNGRLGYYQDEESSLYSIGQRPYETETGRWLSRDPLAEDESNLYRYVSNDPVSETDPSGLQHRRKMVLMPDGSVREVRVDERTAPPVRRQINRRFQQQRRSLNSPDVRWQLDPYSRRPEWELRAAREAIAKRKAAEEQRKAQEKALLKKFERIPESRIKSLYYDRELRFYWPKGDDKPTPYYAAVSDIVGDRVLTFVLRRENVGLGLQAVRKDIVWYSLAKVFTSVPKERTLEALRELRTRRNSQEWANKFIEFVIDLDETERCRYLSQSLTGIYHLAPFGAAFDAFSQGKWFEGTMSLGGDAALFAGPIGKAIAAGRAGAGSARAISLERRFRLAAVSIEGSVAATRFTQGIVAIVDDKTGEAYGYFGEAFLRLIGVSKDTLALRRLKTRQPAKMQAPKGPDFDTPADRARRTQPHGDASSPPRGAETAGATGRRIPIGGKGVADRGAWELKDALKRGEILEPKLGKNTSKQFPVYDIWDPKTGRATSIKTTDITRDLKKVEADMRRFVRESQPTPAQSAKGELAREGLRIRLDEIRQKGLRFGIEPGKTTAKHKSLFERIRDYAKKQGLDFVEFVEVK